MTIKRTAPGAATLALVIILAACGGGEDDATTDVTGRTSAGPGEVGGGADDDELTTVRLGTLPIAASHAIDVGVSEGIFAANGIEIEIVSGQGGGATLPAVTAGDIDMAIGNPISVLLAETQGIDLRLVAGFSNSRAEARDGKCTSLNKEEAHEHIATPARRQCSSKPDGPLDGLPGLFADRS